MKIVSARARHAEIARRYAWQAQQRHQGRKLDHNGIIARVRLKELERYYRRRYGSVLPNEDEAALDDLTIAAHHIVFMRGEVEEHIVAWARRWAPWMPETEARALARRVMDSPQKFTADKLAWRLGLTMEDRTALQITTIGACDMSKAEREEERKRKHREACRAWRARNSTGRPRGRPRKKCENSRERYIAVLGFSDAEGTSTCITPAVTARCCAPYGPRAVTAHETLSVPEGVPRRKQQTRDGRAAAIKAAQRERACHGRGG